MVKTTHIMGGVAFALAIPLITPINEAAPLVALTLSAGVAALLPDIDKKNTAISNKHKLVSFVFRLFCTHRGFTHSLLALFLFAGITLPLSTLPYIGRYIYMGLVLGYFSHLILDMLNPDGVPVLFPLKYRLSLMKIKTGHIGEYLFRVVLAAIIVLEVVNGNKIL